MAGGGGGFFSDSRFDPADFMKKMEAAEDGVADAEFKSSVAEFLADEVSQYNDRDVEGIQALFEEVTSDLKDEFEGNIALLFGGSISKRTYVDGLSDVDALVILSNQHGESTPEEIKARLASILISRYGQDSVRIGQLAVTLLVRGQEIQLLPAFREGAHFKISSPDGSGWSKIKPGNFAEALTKANGNLNGKLIPCIKICKAILATLPEKKRLSGYHVESLAINVFKGYEGEKNLKSMTRHFFEAAAEQVKSPIQDSSGQSIHVDEYLGAANSLERRIISDSLARIGRRLKNADNARSIEGWKEVFR